MSLWQLRVLVDHERKGEDDWVVPASQVNVLPDHEPARDDEDCRDHMLQKRPCVVFLELRIAFGRLRIQVLQEGIPRPIVVPILRDLPEAKEYGADLGHEDPRQHVREHHGALRYPLGKFVHYLLNSITRNWGKLKK